MGKLEIDAKTLLPKNMDDKTRTAIVKSMYELDEADRAADEKLRSPRRIAQADRARKGDGDCVS